MAGGATQISRSDGGKMQGKGKQFVPSGLRVILALPGGAGFGDVKNRSQESIKRDLARGYISEEAAKNIYGLKS
jgi:N-methylhydantoinase B